MHDKTVTAFAFNPVASCRAMFICNFPLSPTHLCLINFSPHIFRGPQVSSSDLPMLATCSSEFFFIYFHYPNNKGKASPMIWHEDSDGEYSYSCTLSLTSALGLGRGGWMYVKCVTDWADNVWLTGRHTEWVISRLAEQLTDWLTCHMAGSFLQSDELRSWPTDSLFLCNTNGH